MVASFVYFIWQHEKIFIVTTLFRHYHIIKKFQRMARTVSVTMVTIGESFVRLAKHFGWEMIRFVSNTFSRESQLSLKTKNFIDSFSLQISSSERWNLWTADSWSKRDQCSELYKQSESLASWCWCLHSSYIWAIIIIEQWSIECASVSPSSWSFWWWTVNFSFSPFITVRFSNVECVKWLYPSIFTKEEMTISNDQQSNQYWEKLTQNRLSYCS